MRRWIISQVKMRHRLPGGMADLTHTYIDDANGGGEYIVDDATGEWWWTANDGSYYHGDAKKWEGYDSDGNYFHGTSAQLPPTVPNQKTKPNTTQINWTTIALIAGAALLLGMISKKK